jgi:hypothetical protein
MSIILEEEEWMKETIGGVPVCSTNLSILILDTASHIGEVHYKIGNRLYIENAD